MNPKQKVIILPKNKDSFENYLKEKGLSYCIVAEEKGYVAFAIYDSVCQSEETDYKAEIEYKNLSQNFCCATPWNVVPRVETYTPSYESLSLASLIHQRSVQKDFDLNGIEGDSTILTPQDSTEPALTVRKQPLKRGRKKLGRDIQKTIRITDAEEEELNGVAAEYGIKPGRLMRICLLNARKLMKTLTAEGLDIREISS